MILVLLDDTEASWMNAIFFHGLFNIVRLQGKFHREDRIIGKE